MELLNKFIDFINTIVETIKALVKKIRDINDGVVDDDTQAEG